MRILNFGSCNIDYVYSLNHIVRVGESQTSYNLDVFAGGKGLNQSIAASKAGAMVYHAGCIGNDGHFLKQILEECGVDVSYLQSVDSKNGHAIIQLSADGSNSIVLYQGSNVMLSEKFVDSVLENFDSNDIVVLQNEINCVDYIVEKAYAKNIPIVLNPSPCNEKISKIDLNKISYLILNEIEIQDISNCKNFQDGIDFLLKKYPKLKIMLTIGAKGSIFANKEKQYVQYAYNVKVIDTTAAGDTFTGYFVAGILKKCGIENTLKMASMAAAIAVSKKGAAPSIPTSNEVENELNKLL